MSLPLKRNFPPSADSDSRRSAAAKAARAAKKKQHVIHLKEVKFRPGIDDHDFDFKTRHARQFLEDGNKVKVHRIVAATDPGYAVNPAQIDRQVAGSFVYGLSALFMQECTVKGGRIAETNFDTYDSMRIAQMPKVESIVMGSGGFFGGVGEPTICVAAPAVLNAYAAATGKRIRSFPLKHHDITLA